MNRKNPAIDAHIASGKKWQAEIKALRRIILDTGLTEELKWDQPCYTHDSHKKPTYSTLRMDAPHVLGKRHSALAECDQVSVKP